MLLAIYVVQYMWCTPMQSTLCGAICVLQSMRCKLRHAVYLVQSTWGNLCGVRYVVQSMWCALCGAIDYTAPRATTSHARANILHTRPQLGRQSSFDSDCWRGNADAAAIAVFRRMGTYQRVSKAALARGHIVAGR